MKNEDIISNSILEQALGDPNLNTLLELLEEKDLKIPSAEQYFKIGERIFAVDQSINSDIFKKPGDQFLQALKYFYLAVDYPNAEKMRDYCILALLEKKLDAVLVKDDQNKITIVRNTNDYKKFFESERGQKFIDEIFSVMTSQDNKFAYFALGDIYEVLGNEKQALNFFSQSALPQAALRCGIIQLSMKDMEAASKTVIKTAIDSEKMEIKYQPAFDFLTDTLANPNKLNHAKTQLALGMFYFNQVNLQGNLNLVDNAIHWLALAANQGDAEAKFYLGQTYRAKPDAWRFGEKSLDLIIESAQLGWKEAIKQLEREESSRAQLALATLYYEQKKFDKSIKVFKKLIDQKNLEAFSQLEEIAKIPDCKFPDAQLLLAEAYEEGKIAYDSDKAIYFYKFAAMNRSPAALTRLQCLANLDPHIIFENLTRKMINANIALAEFYFQEKLYQKVVKRFFNEKIFLSNDFHNKQSDLIVRLIKDEEFNQSNIFKQDDFQPDLFIKTLMKFQTAIGNLSNYFLQLLQNSSFSQRATPANKALIVSYLLVHEDEHLTKFPSELKNNLAEVIRYYFQVIYCHQGTNTLSTELPEFLYLKMLAVEHNNATAQYLLGCCFLSKGFDDVGNEYFQQAQKNGHPLAMHPTSDLQLILKWLEVWDLYRDARKTRSSPSKLLDNLFGDQISSQLNEAIWLFCRSFKDHEQDTITSLEETALKLFADPQGATKNYNSKLNNFCQSIWYNDGKNFHELFGFINFFIQQACREVSLQRKFSKEEEESDDELNEENNSDQEGKSFG